MKKVGVENYSSTKIKLLYKGSIINVGVRDRAYK